MFHFVFKNLFEDPWSVRLAVTRGQSEWEFLHILSP